MPHRHQRRPAVDVDTSRFDVIIGEVKTAEAELNPAFGPRVQHIVRVRTVVVLVAQQVRKPTGRASPPG